MQRFRANSYFLPRSTMLASNEPFLSRALEIFSLTPTKSLALFRCRATDGRVGCIDPIVRQLLALSSFGFVSFTVTLSSKVRGNFKLVPRGFSTAQVA